MLRSHAEGTILWNSVSKMRSFLMLNLAVYIHLPQCLIGLTVLGLLSSGAFAAFWVGFSLCRL